MTNKFKAGDKVVRVEYDDGFKTGEVYTVSSCDHLDIMLVGFNRVFYSLYFKLYTEPTTTLKGFFLIKDEEHSKLVQEHLFSLGYDWLQFGKKVIHTDAAFIYVDKYLSHANIVNAEIKEYTLESSTTYFVKEVVPEKALSVETINIGGVEYSKDDVENALKGLQPLKSGDTYGN